jgi:hypothetical protein
MIEFGTGKLLIDWHFHGLEERQLQKLCRQSLHTAFVGGQTLTEL